jgi:hypothetical protein
VAGHDQRHRIAAESYARFPRGPGVASERGELAIGDRLAMGEPARRRIDVAAEVVDPRHVDRREGEIDRLALGIAPDRGREPGDFGGQRILRQRRRQARRLRGEPRAGCVRIRLRQDQAGEAVLAPGDGEEAKCGFEGKRAGRGGERRHAPA